MPPPNLAARFQRLPPILHSQSLVSLSSCSKGSRGLSVLLRVNCIGTAISISLSPSPRSAEVVTPFVQVGTYPTRNFATLGPLYLRPPFTGASDHRFALRLTNPLNLPAPGRSQTLYVDLSSSQSPVFLVNSRYRHFSATLIGFVCTTTPTEGPPSSEVTVVICRVPWREFSQSP